MLREPLAHDADRIVDGEWQIFSCGDWILEPKVTLRLACGIWREITDCLPCRSGVRRQVDLMPLASISSRLFCVYAAVSETLQQLRYE